MPLSRPSHIDPCFFPTRPQAFHARSGRAYLFNTVVNVALGPPVHRQMTSGRFRINDVECNHCASPLGWHYAGAESPEQRYKVGRTCLERAFLDVDVGSGPGSSAGASESSDDEGCA